MPRSVFVTGAGGFLGRYLLEALGSLGADRVTPMPGRPAADLLVPATYEALLAGCETVFHLAAATGKLPEREFFRVNVDGTRALLEACRRAGVRRFLHISSIAAGFANLSHYPYGRSKLASEELVKNSGLDFTIIRPTLIIGRNAPALQGLAKLAALPVVPLFGDARVQPIYAGDLARCLAALDGDATAAGRTIPIGGPQVLTMAELMARLAPRPPRFLRIPAALVIPPLAVAERVLLPLLPVTAGQLESFRNDGIAPDNSFARRLCPAMKTLDEVLRLDSADAPRPA